MGKWSVGQKWSVHHKKSISRLNQTHARAKTSSFPTSSRLWKPSADNHPDISIHGPDDLCEHKRKIVVDSIISYAR